MELLLPVISRWVHVIAAIIAVGGMFFLRVVLTPAANAALSDDDHAALRAKVLGRWKLTVHVCIALLLLSGIYNYYRAWRFTHPPGGDGAPLYHALVGVKMIVSVVVFIVAAGLVGRSETFAWMRKNRSKWLSINFALALVVVLIAGVLRNL